MKNVYLSKIKSKISMGLSVFFLICFSLSPIPSQAYEVDGDRELRKGNCWLDGNPNCRKKREGTECEERNHCSAQSYLTAAGTLLGVIVAVDGLTSQED